MQWRSPDWKTKAENYVKFGLSFNVELRNGNKSLMLYVVSYINGNDGSQMISAYQLLLTISNINPNFSPPTYKLLYILL